MSSRSIFGPGLLVLPPSRAGYKYGALLRWFARQRQSSSGSAPELLKFSFFMPAFFLRVTGRLIFEHGYIVRFVNDGFGTVPDVRCWWCGCQCVHLLLRGWQQASTVSQTGCSSTPVALSDPRVVLIFCFSPGVSGWSFSPAARSLAPWVLRGVVLRAGGPGVLWLVSVSLRLLAR